MPDWSRATKAVLRLAAASGVPQAVVVDATIELLRALLPADSETSEVTRRLDRLERRDFANGLRQLERARDAENDDFRERRLADAAGSFDRALDTTDIGVEHAAIRYHCAVAHLMLREHTNARRDLEVAVGITPQLTEFDRVLLTERRLHHEKVDLRSRLIGAPGAGFSRRAMTTFVTYVTMRSVVYPLSFTRWWIRSWDDRRYLRSAAAVEAKRYFDITEKTADVSPEIRDLERAISETAAAVTSHALPPG
jgi:hypothetical protein